MVRMYHVFFVFLLMCSALSNAFGQAVTINYSDGCAQMGETVVVDVRADGFTNVRNFNFLTQWDDALLEYVSVDNRNPIFPAGELDFGTPDITGKPDRITAALIQVSSPVEYTLNPSDIIFSITLRVKNSTAGFSNIDTLDILPKNEFVVFNGGTETKVKPGSNRGRVDVNVPCDGTGVNIFKTVESSGLPGTEVCIPFVGLDLTDLGGFNGMRFNFDPNVLSYNRVVNKTNPQGTPIINDLNASSGQLEMIYSYVGPGGTGLSADSVALFCLCFTVEGDCDQSISLSLSEAPSFGIFNSSNDPIAYDLESGQFEVNCCDVTSVINPVTCPGGSDGSIALTPVGCTNVTAYNWSNSQSGSSINNLTGGSYDVTITYDGGASTRVVTGLIVNEPASFTQTSISFTKVVNGGDGGIDIEIAGGTPTYTYLWSNGANTQDLTNINAGDYSLTVTDSRNCTATFGPFTVASAPQISGVVTNVSCFGTSSGGVTLMVSGGATPYTYSWSCAGTVDPGTGSISGLSGGNCTVTVTDNNNCASTMTFNIGTPPSDISTNVNVVNDVANNGNGSIDLGVSGGCGDYTYTWDDGTSEIYPNTGFLTGLFGGEYRVTVTDGCNCSREFGPFAVQGLRVFASAINPVQCFGDNNGAINIGVFGGSGSYTYDWSCSGNVDVNGNISGLTSGPCTVTVTDVTQNSTSVATFVVPGPTEALTVTVGEVQCTSGADGELAANVDGGVAPFTYQWNTTPEQNTANATNLVEGNYSVIVTDSVGCQVMGLGTAANCDQLECYTAMDVITPNADGMNDLFIIDCVGNTRTKLRIYTRWGQEVITYDNYANNWDGRDEGGNLVDEDTYLWVLEVFPVTGNTELYKGAVSVLYSLR